MKLNVDAGTQPGWPDAPAGRAASQVAVAPTPLEPHDIGAFEVFTGHVIEVLHGALEAARSSPSSPALDALVGALDDLARRCQAQLSALESQDQSVQSSFKGRLTALAESARTVAGVVKRRALADADSVTASHEWQLLRMNLDRMRAAP